MSQFFDDDTTADEPAPRGRGRRLVATLLAATVTVLLGGLLAAAAYVGTVTHTVSQNLQRSAQLPPDVPGGTPRPQKAPEAAQAVNYVLLGSDSRTADAGQGRSDVLMVLHLSGDRKSAALVSFPRDLYVPIPGHGRDKINAAFAYGGSALTVRTLEGLLGTRMDHVALIDFDGFVQLTDELGGVTVDNPHPSVSQGFTFPTGPITLNGPEALAYVREREQLPRGDLDRAERQRLVARAILQKAASRPVLTDPAKFTRFVGGLARQVTVDDRLTVAELRTTALSVRFRPSEIASIQAPVKGLGRTRSGQSIDEVDPPTMAELAQALRDDQLGAYLDQHPGR